MRVGDFVAGGLGSNPGTIIIVLLTFSVLAALGVRVFCGVVFGCTSEFEGLVATC